MSSIWLATREDVKRALDTKETARANAAIDRALDSSTDSITALCNRTFYPERRSMTWDWPNQQTARSWRLWLDANELISIESVSSGGVDIPVENVLLRPDDGPPFTRIELDLGTNSSFGVLLSPQRSITIVGLYGHRNTEAPAGTLAANVTAGAATVTVTDASLIGVGQLLRIDAERLIVTGRRSVTTGQTQQGDLTAHMNNTLLPVSDGTTFAIDEVITLDGERMLIVDITGNNLVVIRAWDGTVLAAHSGATIYASRQLTVSRGVLGTTAAAHTGGASIVKWQSPGNVRTLAVAEALNTGQAELSAYARTQSALGEGTSGFGTRSMSQTALMTLRSQVQDAYGRHTRMRAV
jgi:hypothetical protein